MNFSSESLFYATPELDRRPDLRRATRLTDQMRIEKPAVFIPLFNNQNLFVHENGASRPLFILHHEAENPDSCKVWAYLGACADHDYFAIDLNEDQAKAILTRYQDQAFFEDLRKAGPIVQKADAARCAYARGILYWQKRHLFCGLCGSATRLEKSGHMRQCTNPACGVEHFPRLDPAVIMLVHRADTCLLAHHHRQPDHMYSTLAGFVEPGETLEAAVRREVMEETGVLVSDVTYAGSQPWPFPTSLMIGFYAKAESEEIFILKDELEDAQWFHMDALRAPKNNQFILPSRDSISRNLIESWVNSRK